MIEQLLALVPAIVAGAAAGLIAWGGIRAELRHVQLEAIRAHKRLDAINAPNFTLSEPL